MFYAQSLNRYAYVINNPLRYFDPTGHRNCEEDGYNCSGDNLFDLKYGISLKNVSEKDKKVFREAVQDVANALLRDCLINGNCGSNKTSATIFKQTYGVNAANPFLFSIGSCEECGNGHAYTHNAHWIEFSASHPLYISGANRSEELTFSLNVHNVVHELGHAFANLWSYKDPVSNKYSFSDGSPYMVSMSAELQGNSGYAIAPVGASDYWQMHRARPEEDAYTRIHESFADMFLGWTYGEDMADFRKDYIAQMNGWISDRTTP